MSTAVQISTEQERRASQEAVRTHIRGGFHAAGREMLRMRPTIPHGEWGAYCEGCGMTTSMAGHLMRCTKAVDAGEVPGDLSLKGTMKAISDTRREDQIGNGVTDLDETEPAEPVQSTFDPFAVDDEPEIPDDVLERIDACLEDDSYSDDEYAKMRGNRRNVLAGVISPEKFLERWERTPPPAPEPATPAAPVVVTPIEGAPEPSTERAVVNPVAEPRNRKPTLAEQLEHACAERDEANRDYQLSLFKIEDLEQQLKVAVDELAQHNGEANTTGGGTAWAEVRKAQAEARTYQARMMEWQQKYEDERRHAAALKRQLKQHTG